MGGCWGKCDLIENKEGETPIFKPVSKRCCTDILCLLIFFAYTLAMIIIGAMALSNGNIDYVLYPQDYLGQFCGKTLADKKKALYPRLGKDLIEQSALLVAGPVGFVNFRPYTLCVDECPDAFSLSDPQLYGGPSYTGAAADAPSFYNLQPTDEFFNRCLPRTDTQPGLDRQLCGAPACESEALVSCLGQTMECTVGANAIDADPTVTTAWVVDPSDAAQVGCCEFQVAEHNTQIFLPPDVDAEVAAQERQFADYIAAAFGVMDGLQTNLTEILVMGLAAPLAFAMVWFLLLFVFAGFLIILALFLFLCFLVALTIYLYYMSGLAKDLGVDVTSLTNFSAITAIPSVPESGVSQVTYAVLAVIFTIVTLIYIVFIFLSRDAIVRCISIVREVTKVFFALPFMAVWPLVGVLFYIAVIVYGVGIGGFILTQGVDENTFEDVASALNSTAANAALDSLLSLSPTTQITIMFAIHVVGCIWALFITQAATYTTLSRSCAVWFFSHGKDSSGQVVQQGTFFFGTRVVTVCAYCVISRHLGSVCFGAAILTIMTIIRLILGAIEYYMKDLKNQNCLLYLALKCAQCTVWCLDRTVRFITYYGFIFVAIEGSSFCVACFSTFSFASKYLGQMSVNRLVANLLSCAISLSIPVGAAMIGFFWVDQQNRPQPLTAALCILVCAFVIASAITDVFRCCIDTIFVCAFKDMEDSVKQGTSPKYMSSDLQKNFGLDTAERSGPKITGTASSGGSSDELQKA